MGFDTETVEGLPYTCQMADSAGNSEVVECYGRAEVVRAQFAKLFDKLPARGFAVAAAHYLRFDIQVLFRDRPEFFAGIGEVNWKDENGLHWKGSSGWPTIFAIVRYQGKTLLLLDTFRFFFGGLARVCKDLNIETQKLERPACIAENRAPTPAELEYFLDYALTDAVAVLDVLRWVVKIWEMENVGPCISIAHQAGRIFRRNYTRLGGKIVGLDAVDEFGQLAGLAAYHGGRNSVGGFPEDGRPLIVDDAAMYDVRSMYPWICAQLLPCLLYTSDAADE